MLSTIIILINIFKSLGVSQANNYACFLFKNNFNNHFTKMCKNSIEKHTIQTGGDFKIMFEGLEFTIGKYMDDHFSMFLLDSSDGETNCLTIRINKKNKVAEILGLGFFSQCFSNKQMEH
jgi:hypothetical protein